MKLRIADSLSVPIDAVTQKIAWLGRTGSGKTYGTKRFVEQMLHAVAQVVVLDGSGAWAGLRLGKHPFKIPVLGGLYGDIPLESTGGALVADVIVDTGTSMVIDVSQMLDAERNRFAAAFAERFFFRKKSSPSAVHLVLEECQDYVPENQQRGEERMLHEFQRLAKQGRAHGIGMSFISQRPQEISKKALNQVECVFAFQMTGPQERKALQYWLSDKGFESELAKILPHLEIGAPHVWSPQWLKVSKVVQILPIDSLDTSRTPKVGDKRATRKALKPIDLHGLEKSMAETIERAKADDPKELRKRIVELEKELKKKPPVVSVVPQKVIVAAPVDWKRMRRRMTQELKRGFDELEKLAINVIVDEDVLHTEDVRKMQASKALLTSRLVKEQPPIAITSEMMDHHDRAMRDLRAKSSNGASKRDPSIGTSGLYRIMVALAQRPNGLSRRSLGARAGLSSRTGTFGTYLSRARTAGWVDGSSELRITESGLGALGHYDPLPEGAALLEFWLREIGDAGGAGRMLRVLSEAYPNALSRAELAERANLSEKTGTFGTYLSRLRGLELIEGKTEIRMVEELSS